MKNWLDTLDRLAAARNAREEFLLRDFIDRSIIGPMLLDRLAADLKGGAVPFMANIESLRLRADDEYLK